jgi:hypothetical protein
LVFCIIPWAWERAVSWFAKCENNARPDEERNRFAQAFNRAFLCTGDIYEITIFGYTGKISPKPQTLTEGNITFANDLAMGRKSFPGSIPEDYTGPKKSVVPGVEHRWSKIDPLMYQSRASEARSKVAWLKAVKGTVSQKWGV